MSDRVVLEFRQPIPPGATPRPATPDEVNGWLQAASERVPPRENDVRKLRHWLRGRDRRKYDKLQSLMRWAEREMLKQYGLNPEDVRWLLP